MVKPFHRIVKGNVNEPHRSASEGQLHRTSRPGRHSLRPFRKPILNLFHHSCVSYPDWALPSKFLLLASRMRIILTKRLDTPGLI